MLRRLMSDREEEQKDSAPEEVPADQGSSDAGSDDEGNAGGDDAGGDDADTDASDSAHAPRSSKKASERGRRAPGSSLSEEEINAPSIQTLIMLGVISLSTLILWAAGRAACNYQVPGESLTPRKIPLEERTRSAKATAFEFSQLISCADFKVARTLAQDQALEYVAAEEKACAPCTAEVSACDRVRSVASVLKANSLDNIVEVTTRSAKGSVTRTMGVERKERKWIVSRVYRDKNEATLKPAPEAEGAPEAPEDALEASTPEEPAVPLPPAPGAPPPALSPAPAPAPPSPPAPAPPAAVPLSP